MVDLELSTARNRIQYVQHCLPPSDVDSVLTILFWFSDRSESELHVSVDNIDFSFYDKVSYR